ncbi:MAG: glycoside hydrolase family 5 protein [Lachnospiraceae bacterium]|nr:glycoside hydrolase family 5 protein [Lachnospiraceae bacterium]
MKNTGTEQWIQTWKKWTCFLLIVLCAAMLDCGSLQAAKLPALKVKGTQLVNAKGKPVRLKGASTHGLSWFPEYVNQKSFSHLKKNWKANTVRLALYTSEYNGYCTGDAANRRALEKRVADGVKYATKAGLYVIIDWHILSDGNPKTYQKQAVSFFKKMAGKYKNYTNVIYEICNEPNGGTSWSDIKSYAKKVVKAIRSKDKDAVILIGTPNWSQDVDIAAKSPLKGYKNLMYTLHFYAGTHGESLRRKAKQALKMGLPLFVSEFGISDASGNGSLNQKEGKKWMKFLKDKKISYIGWSLSNKAESSALIKPSCKKTAGWKASDLTPWGKWLVKQW